MQNDSPTESSETPRKTLEAELSLADIWCTWHGMQYVFKSRCQYGLGEISWPLNSSLTVKRSFKIIYGF